MNEKVMRKPKDSVLIFKIRMNHDLFKTLRLPICFCIFEVIFYFF